ncbi:Hypothetical protein NTJ_06605 [Nesidiocoris tenuis]|uniref:Uncharacterized protein n=1 Tax=Nesidiocoris tenuis TaxID=355587 RepID=A0ABN7ASC6_9HEMI|nr:Hypothetical protein NTJ_06605 [Nesidiocoris tenuis]
MCGATNIAPPLNSSCIPRPCPFGNREQALIADQHHGLDKCFEPCPIRQEASWERKLGEKLKPILKADVTLLSRPQDSCQGLKTPVKNAASAYWLEYVSRLNDRDHLGHGGSFPLGNISPSTSQGLKPNLWA